MTVAAALAALLWLLVVAAALLVGVCVVGAVLGLIVHWRRPAAPPDIPDEYTWRLR